MKIDLHCHSDHSPDCLTPVQRVLVLAKERGIDVQAITDHNTIDGALAGIPIARKLGITLIVGEEITTTHGELIGLFLRKAVKKHLSPEQTIIDIKSQGGLVLLPHGFDPFKVSRLRPKSLSKISKSIDIVEGFNARVSYRHFNDRAVKWAKQMGLPMSAGTDAHREKDIGTAWVEAPDAKMKRPLDLANALRKGTIEGRWENPLLAFVRKQFGDLRIRMGWR